MSATVSATTIDQIQPVALVRLVNAIGDWLDAHSIYLYQLSADKLMMRAMRETKLSDWGEDGTAFKAEFERMIRSYREDAKLTLAGRFAAHQALTQWLSNRLQMQHDWTTYPEILEQPVPRPLFVAGLPRSGTTLLHRLLAQDSSARVPLLWELMWPSPPPTIETRETDPRIKKARNLLQRLVRVNSQIQVIHSLNPQEPEECIWLLEEFFAYVHANVVNYANWVIEQDLTHYYRFHRKALQLLQWHCPGDHWILKTPFHTFAMDSILKVYPDACIVQTHRDPEKVIASFCSLIATAHRATSRSVDLHQIGQQAVTMWSKAVNRAMAVRAQADPAHFYDVYYEDTITDPVGITRRVYEHFGYPFTAEHESKIKQWLAENPQNKHGVHRYSLEQFGLDSQTIQQHFGEYIEHFKLGATRPAH